MRILFAGTPEFAAQQLQNLINTEHEIVGVITQPDKPGKRGKKPVASAVKTLALLEGLVVIQPSRLTVEDIEHFNADAMIVVAYGQILRQPVLSLLPFGCINVHGSMLPRWRGAAPIQRAVLAGDQESGICIIQMDKGLDTGPILASKICSIAASDSSGALALKLSELSNELLPRVLSQLITGQSTAKQQAEEGVCYADKINKLEAEVDWSLTSKVVQRQILGFNPEPVAYTYVNDLRIKIWEASFNNDPHDFEPGQIISISKHGIVIACGSGSINVTQLQIPLGKGKILNASDVFNARKDLFSPGVLLGSLKVNS
ncbi:MAG: methionyl-tRNA formyltransferase [Candidatus Azotimanducaceae bacterium]